MVAGDPLVVVVTDRVAGPDDEIDLILDILFDPTERLVDQGEGRIAVRPLLSKVSCLPFAVVAGTVVGR